jgi:hypothetical protein
MSKEKTTTSTTGGVVPRHVIDEATTDPNDEAALLRVRPLGYDTPVDLVALEESSEDIGRREETGDQTPRPGPTGRPQLLAEKCRTCIFRSGDPMHLGVDRIREVINANRAVGALLTCHMTLTYGEYGDDPGPSACRGFYDAYGDESSAARFAHVMMGGFDEVPVPGCPAESRRD